jgi:hypothetical protein
LAIGTGSTGSRPLIVDLSTGSTFDAAAGVEGTVQGFFPAPNSALVALVQVLPRDARVDPDADGVLIRFIDPIALEEQARGVLTAADWQLQPDPLVVHRMMWMNDDEFRLGTNSVRRNGEVVREQPPPVCSEAPTAGGSFNAEGQTLEVEESSFGVFEVSVVDSGESGWPIRCGPASI